MGDSYDSLANGKGDRNEGDSQIGVSIYGKKYYGPDGTQIWPV